MLKKILALYYYEKARNAASHEDYFHALELLNKTPEKARKLFFYLLRAYALERLGQYEESLQNYDKAISVISSLPKVTADEKIYLLKYIDYGYANIYRLKGKLEESKKFIAQAEHRSFDISKVRKYILNDFQVNDI